MTAEQNSDVMESKHLGQMNCLRVTRNNGIILNELKTNTTHRLDTNFQFDHS